MDGNKAIELLWKTCVRTMQGQASEDLKADARQILFDLMHDYGPGWSLEPDHKIHGACNICGAEFEGWERDNPTSCAHIPGRVYNGEECRPVVDKILEVSQVTLSRDEPNMMTLPEDRIWPWMVERRAETPGTFPGASIPD